MATTDTLQMNKTEMFAKIRAHLPAERQQTQNLLECKDDLLFAWDSEGCLLALNWRMTGLDGNQAVKYQTLIPSSPQCFQIERVLASNEGSLIALAGPRGVAVLELPRRWGKNGQFMEGKEKIICRSTNLDAHFFNNNPHLQLRQVRWHPASPTDSHLLVLLSDNTIRVYDNTTLRHVWQVGPIPLKADINPKHSSISTVFALGETVVDFDIAPAVKVSDSYPLNATKEQEKSMTSSRLNQSNTSLNQSTTKTAKKADKIEWPIVLLRENGNIYVLMTSLDTDKPRLQGPITITPQTNDNYGLESCAILVIPSLPPTLVIAESNGKFHHALLLEAENAEDSFNDVDSSLFIHPSEWTVHVLETVELELGLPRHESNAYAYNCPIHLKRDFINEIRYFAYHNTGLHVVSINFIAELQRYFESDVTSDINSLATPSHAEYIVCTKIDTAGDRINAVLGFVLLQMPSGVLLLLGSGQVISLKLVIDPKLLLESSKMSEKFSENDKGKTLTQLNQFMEASFQDHIKSMLQRTVTQPILSLDKSAATPNPQECYELLTQAIEVLRTQYLKRHELVRTEFTKRINTIRLLKEQQRRDIDSLEHEREHIREQAHRLAERFEEISDQQEVLTKRCQDLMRQANTTLPSNTVAEKDFALEVERINNTTTNLSNALQKTREAINKQWYHISKYNETAKHKAFQLPEKQERTIKEILLQITSEIDDQVKEVKRISKVVDL